MHNLVNYFCFEVTYMFVEFMYFGSCYFSCYSVVGHSFSLFHCLWERWSYITALAQYVELNTTVMQNLGLVLGLFQAIRRLERFLSLSLQLKYYLFLPHKDEGIPLSALHKDTSKFANFFSCYFFVLTAS